MVADDFGFWTDHPELFPNISLDWRNPSLITNAIIDINNESCHDYEKISEELDVLGCEGLQLRVYDIVGIDSVVSCVLPFKRSRLRSIDLILKYSDTFSIKNLSSLCIAHQRIRSVVIHTSPVYRKASSKGNNIPILFTKEEVMDHTHCGVVDPSYFTMNISSFTESINYNSCLNRKVGIDTQGYIKNCPSMSQSFGNIKDTTLMEAVNKKGFKGLLK